MGRPRRKERIYWRNRAGTRRAYADLRDYAAEGGGLEALIPSGEHKATTDRDVAAKLLAARLQELEQRRKTGRVAPRRKSATLAPYIAHHLELKARSRRFTAKWIAESRKRLGQALDYFGDVPLEDITPRGVQAFAEYLEGQKGRRGERLASGTIRHSLNVLSSLYARAISEGVVPAGSNPVANMVDKPIGRREEARFLSVEDAALLLEAAKVYERKRAGAIPFMYELLATFLLTGGRKAEVLGLEPADVSLDRGVVMFRDYPHRRLKTRGSRRNVPLFPQLREILGPYLSRTDAAPGPLLFPSRTGGMITDLRKPLAEIAKLAGLAPADVHLHALRHTWTAARLQTLEGGHPITPFQVSRELGHTSTALVEKIYGHVQGSPHRAPHVEFRLEQHTEKLADRLRELGAMRG